VVSTLALGAHTGIHDLVAVTGVCWDGGLADPRWPNDLLRSRCSYVGRQTKP
jgi:hypothetical protein